MDIAKILTLTKILLDVLNKASNIGELLKRLENGEEITDAEMDAVKEKRKEAVNRWNQKT